MRTPVCIANAVADALGLADIDLPLTPAKLAGLDRTATEPAPAAGQRAAGRSRRKPGDRGHARRGRGARWRRRAEAVWAMLLDPERAGRR